MIDFPSNHAEISDFMFHLSLMDLSDLRNKYRRANIDLPIGIAMRAKRNGIIEHLAQEKFGVDVMHKYHLLCIEWDTTEKIVNNKNEKLR